MSLPLHSLVGWVAMNARRIEEALKKTPLRPEYGVKCETRNHPSGTRQWRFSYVDPADYPGLEVIVACFPPGVGFPVHQHLNEEEFMFLSSGVWTWGEADCIQATTVTMGDTFVTAANVPHGWRPTNPDEPGLMVVIKYPVPPPE